MMYAAVDFLLGIAVFLCLIFVVPDAKVASSSRHASPRPFFWGERALPLPAEVALPADLPTQQLGVPVPAESSQRRAESSLQRRGANRSQPGAESSQRGAESSQRRAWCSWHNESVRAAAAKAEGRDPQSAAAAKAGFEGAGLEEEGRRRRQEGKRQEGRDEKGQEEHEGKGR